MIFPLQHAVKDRIKEVTRLRRRGSTSLCMVIRNETFPADAEGAGSFSYAVILYYSD
jgi:hypothetical protein